MALGEYLRLMRINQWYKNLVVFLALFFTSNFFNPEPLSKAVLAFASMCLMSSSCYVLNDIADAKRDRIHPENRMRPIASGKVTAPRGYAMVALLFAASIIIAWQLSAMFTALALLLFASSTAYTAVLRDVPLIDLHLIALNFLIRAVSGAVAINVRASEWLITTVFFTALLLGIGKRRSELALLGNKAVRFKPVYGTYTESFLDQMRVIVSSVLLMSYILYTFFVHPGTYLMATLPFATFVMFRYFQACLAAGKPRRMGQRPLLDWQIGAASFSWAAITFYLLYVANG